MLKKCNKPLKPKPAKTVKSVTFVKREESDIKSVMSGGNRSSYFQAPINHVNKNNALYSSKLSSLMDIN